MLSTQKTERDISVSSGVVKFDHLK